MRLAIASLFALVGTALCQSTYVDPAVPTGTPVPGNYTGGLRPQIHFSPPQHFMNDPNGMFVDANGTWHLYYQYNPTGIVAGNQHWGHATSKDLYHWTNQKIALFPPFDTVFVFSGSAVVDTNNTSGFFPGQDNGVVAVYTLANYTYGAGPQTQNIAYSRDGGYTFTPYQGNPVIDSTSNQFRDPKVIRYGNQWVMVVSFAAEFTIGFYTSPNLVNWTFASNFSHHGLLGLQYECPNFVEVPVQGGSGSMWMLAISINPGAPLGGSITEYFLGSFNGTHFTTSDAATRIADFGKDNYAGQWFYDARRNTSLNPVSIAWASNWQYTQVVPTGELEGWRSSMSLPRRNYIANATRIGQVLISQPYDLSPVLGQRLVSNSSLGNGSVAVDYSSLYSNALYFEVNVTNIPSANISGSATINMTFLSPVSGESLTSGFYVGGDTPFFINRGGIRGFDNPFFTNSFSTNTLIGTDGAWSVSGVIDRSILEVFLNGGKASATTTFYPEQPLTIMSLKTALLPPNVTVSVGVWEIKSAWQAEENVNGTVVGNVTMSGNSTRTKREAGYVANF